MRRMKQAREAIPRRWHVVQICLLGILCLYQNFVTLGELFFFRELFYMTEINWAALRAWLIDLILVGALAIMFLRRGRGLRGRAQAGYLVGVASADAIFLLQAAAMPYAFWRWGPEAVKLLCLDPPDALTLSFAGVLELSLFLLPHLIDLILFVWLLYRNLRALLDLVRRRLRWKARGLSVVTRVLAGALCLALLLTPSGCEALLVARREDFEPILEVITEDDGTGERRFYALGTEETQCRSCPPFEPEPCEIYKGFAEGVGFKNILVGMPFLDHDNNRLTHTAETDAILAEIEAIDHPVMSVWLIHADGQWFAQAMLNVNLWTPYEFYWYDPERGGLRRLYVFNGEYVVGLRILDAARLGGS